MCHEVAHIPSTVRETTAHERQRQPRTDRDVPFANIDDKFPDHPKVAGLSDAAFRLHVTGILYCNRHLTDGRVPQDEVPRLVRRFQRKALDELLSGDEPLWAKNGVGYQIHDYLDWNDSRSTVLERRAAAVERAKRSRGNRAK